METEGRGERGRAGGRGRGKEKRVKGRGEVIGRGGGRGWERGRGRGSEINGKREKRKSRDSRNYIQFILMLNLILARYLETQMKLLYNTNCNRFQIK